MRGPLASVPEVIEELRRDRQMRRYRPEPVPEYLVNELLAVARWTGSLRNSQPWHFLVVPDKEQMRQISQIRPPIN